jgi:hypothetical protein
MIKLKPILFCLALHAQGLLNKLKQKAAEAAEKAVDKKTDEMINGKRTDQDGNSSVSDAGNNTAVGPGMPSKSSGGKPVNKGGAGLITTPPDVKGNLSTAETSFKAGSYGEARYAIQQAMLGVELQIGQNILKGLPETVSGLPKQAEKDQVASSGFGWAGLTIQREYLKDDKQLTFTLANNSMWMSALNMFLTNGAFGQTTTSTGDKQNMKQIKVKGNKAVIQYEDNTGYKISIPIGQSSLLMFEGINFANEQEITAAANAFDIDAIKKTLGEK